MYALLLVLSAISVVAAQPGADLLSVQQESLDVPLKAIGQLTNGCTGYLIGPCHVSNFLPTIESTLCTPCCLRFQLYSMLLLLHLNMSDCCEHTCLFASLHCLTNLE